MAHLTLTTGVSRSLADHFSSTAESVAAARQLLESRSHQVRWIVAIDGVGHGAIPGEDLADEAIHLGKQFGVSTARNVAATRAPEFSWVLPIDGDDLLVAEGVLELAECLDAVSPSTGWVASNRTEMDGTTGPWWASRERTYEPGELNAEYRHPHTFHPNNVAYRREALFAVGGWPAMPGGEDLALTLRVAARYSGAVTCTVTVRYRRWEKQTMNSDYARLRPERHRLFDLFGVLGDRDIKEMRLPEPPGTPSRKSQ